MTEGRRSPSSTLSLGRDGLRIAFDAETGTIVSFGDDRLGLDLVGRPAVAEAWRLLVPLPERKGHYIRSSGQRLTRHAVSEDAVELEWGPLTSEGLSHDIRVVMRVALDGDELTFTGRIENDGPLVVEEALFPCVGGVTRPEDPSAWRLVGPRVISGGFEYPIFDDVPSSYHGPGLSNLVHPYPGGWIHPLALGMPWVSLTHPDGRTLYIGDHDEAVTFSAFWVELDAQLRFDTGTMMALGSSAQQRWPESHQDPQASMNLAWVSFPFIGPGSSWEAPPIVVGSHREGWRGSARRYRQRHDERPTPAARRTWLSDADAWLTVIMMFNDGTVVNRPGDLPRIAAQAAAIGIRAILLLGWSTGGLDGGMPSYDLDPRIGDDADLTAALRECEALGVRVMLMAQVGQVIAGSDWFRSEGHRYVVQNPAGEPYYAGGVFYGWNTLLDQLGYSAPQIVTGNPAHPPFRELILRELGHIVDLGAHGVLLDKLNTGDPYSLDYNPGLPGTPANRFHAGLVEVVAEYARQVDARRPDFAIAAETGWDRVMPWTEASYTRYFDRDHLPFQEAIYPEVRLTTTITGDSDLAMVNNALRHGHVICLEPRYFHAGLEDVPNLAAYAAEAIRLRATLRHLLWDGLLVDPEAATVEGDDIYHGVFESVERSADGPIARAVVLNHFELAGRDTRVDIPGARREVVLHRPFRPPEPAMLPLETSIPPREYLVVVMDEGRRTAS